MANHRLPLLAALVLLAVPTAAQTTPADKPPKHVEIHFQLKAGTKAATLPLPRGWSLTGEIAPGSGIQLANPSGDVTDAQAWDAAHAIEKLPGALWAEPAFSSVTEEVTLSGGTLGEKRKLKSLEQDEWDVIRELSESDDDWADRILKVERPADCKDDKKCPSAWALEPTGAAGIKVCHPDTGYTEHPETFGPRLLVAEGQSYLTNRRLRGTVEVSFPVAVIAAQTLG